MTKLISLFLISILSTPVLHAQIDSLLLRPLPNDSAKAINLNMDAIYNRPFWNMGKMPVSIGGYAEVNWQHIGTDGVSEGHQFQMRRMTLFVASDITKRIKFLSEIELEEGGKEINIEFAAVDMEIKPLLNLRGGIVMNPIGGFNQNHDGPKWEFTDRPIASTQMLPATFSNAGFGLFGKMYRHQWMLGYEAYVTGGFSKAIIDNEEGKTFLPAAKNNPERFEEGNLLFTGKIAAGKKNIGELGLSVMSGAYNKKMEDGIPIEDKTRRATVLAIDYNNTLPGINSFITGEWAWVWIDVPASYTQQYGNKQMGGFIDIVQPIIKKKMLGWDDAQLNVALRCEYVDWNAGRFTTDGSRIGDNLWSIMPAISFRPGTQTVIRLNYRYQQQKDLHNNPPSKTGGFSIGLSTYF